MRKKSIFSTQHKCFFVLMVAVMFTSAIFTVQGQNYPDVVKSGEKRDYLVKRGERPPINYDEINEDAYDKGVLIIKFKENYERHLEAHPFTINRDGVVNFHIDEVDRLNSRYDVKYAKQHFLSPALNNTFTERHKAWGFHLWYVLRVDEKTDIRQMRREYSKLPGIEIAEPSFKKVLHSSVTKEPDNTAQAPADGGKNTGWTPNDPMFNTQWHYHNTGQHGGTEGADIDLIAAWTMEKGHSDVIVAVIDQGIQFDHPDLAANMWQNASGHYGYNFYDDSSLIVPGYHGTHVAGTVAAVSNNSTGVAGIAGGSGTVNGVRLMSCQIYKGSGGGIGHHLAMVYAADNGAAISQNSWVYTTPDDYNQDVLDAIDYFNTNGGGDVMSNGITIFGAGNYNSNANYYPGYYSGTLAVAATNNQDKKASYSNYGTWIDISAPGGETGVLNERGVRSTLTESNYGYLQGTSMACPHVSGVAALLISYAHRNATTLNRDQVWALLVDNVDDHYPVNNSMYEGQLGSGRLNAYLALTALINGPIIIWQGTINTQWGNPGNWNLNMVPNNTHNVIIPNTVNKTYLTAPAGYTGHCKSLTIRSGGQLYIGNGVLNVTNDVTIEGALNFYSGPDLDPTIVLGGNWSRTGSFTHHNNGRVVFNGTGHQYVNSNESFSTLEVNNGAALRITYSDRVVSCNVYDWKAGGIDVIAGTFTANDLAQNGLYGGFWVKPGGTINITNSSFPNWVDLYGSVNVLGGTMNIDGLDAWWPYDNGANFTMTSGVLDFKTCGLRIHDEFSWTHNITGGTIRTAYWYDGARTDFNPTAGTLELYGSGNSTINQTSGSTLHHVKINKSAKDNGADHITKPLYDDRRGGFLSDGSKANTISLASNLSITGNLDIDAGTFSMGQYTCNIAGNTNISGTLAMTNASGEINASGNVVWNSGSTANFTAMNVFNVWGHWNFESGSNANLGNGVVAFRGSNDRFVRSHSSGSSFNNISSYKTGGTKVGISAISSQPLTINGYIYVHPEAEFGIYSPQDVILKGNVNSNGAFICNYGTVVLNGANQSLKMNTGNYFNHLTFNQSGKVTIDNSLSNILDVRGNVTIQSGVFSMLDRTMHVGGNWTNTVGPAAFTPGIGRVVFNRPSGHQYVYSSENFNILEVDMDAALRITSADHTVTCNQYHWTKGGIDVIAGTFTANDLAQNGLYGGFWVNPGGTINLTNSTGVTWVDLRGKIYNYGGTINITGTEAFWPYSNEAALTMTDGIIDFKTCDLFMPSVYSGATADVSGGVIRTTGNYGGNWANFVPTGGSVELYGPDNALISQTNGSTLHNLVINKSGGDGTKAPIMVGRDGQPIEKTRGNLVNAVTNLTLTNELTVDDGELSLGGYHANIGGNVSINAGGTLTVDDNATLFMSAAKRLGVNNMGNLRVIGNVGAKATVSLSGTGNYLFDVESGGTLSARHAIFEHMNMNGIVIKPGSVVDPDHPLAYCTFRNGASGGRLLTIHNNQEFTVEGAHFPVNTWLGSYNAYKNVNIGHVTFVDYTGDFAGSAHEFDPYNRIVWGDELYLSVDPPVRNVTAPAGTTTFAVESNTSWTVSESVSWLSVAPMAGSGNGTLIVSYNENTSFSPRSGQLTISAAGVPDVIVTVNQDGVALPINEFVSGTVFSGNYVCYNALQTITVQDFVVEANASVNMVAGHNIIMLPGTHAKSGSYLHAWISETDHCGIILPPALLAVKDEPLITDEEQIQAFEMASFLKVYPNPTTGDFTIELNGFDGSEKVLVQIFSMQGDLVNEHKLTVANCCDLSLAGRQPGIYLVRVMINGQVGVTRVVKK